MAESIENLTPTDIVDLLDEVDYDVRKQKDIDAVNGYIHGLHDKLFMHIASDINHLCCKYYHIHNDQFHHILHGSELILKSDLIRRPYGTALNGQTAFLSNVVGNRIHHWRFKLLKRSLSSHLYIGIWANEIDQHQALNKDVTRIMLQKKNEWKERCSQSDDGYEDWDTFVAYALNARFGQMAANYYGTPCCRKLKEGDIIDMVLDLYNDQLKYSFNGKDEKSFDVRHTEYRAVIGFYQPRCRHDMEDVIQIVLYENKY